MKPGCFVIPATSSLMPMRLELYARSPEVRERHGAAGLAYAKTRDWDEINSAVLKVYARVIDKRERLARLAAR